MGECSDTTMNAVPAQQNGVTAPQQAAASETTVTTPSTTATPETTSKPDASAPALTLAQAEIHEPDFDFLAAPETAWVRECWQGESCTKKRLDGVRPLNDPAKSAKLLYRVVN